MKKYKIGIIGAGHIAHKMAVTVNELEETEAYAIASRDAEKAQLFAQKYYMHAKLCLQHDKPVLCEKAFTANAHQAEELINLARTRNIFLTEAIWTRFIPFSQTVRQLINERIGTPMTLTASLSYPIFGKERIMRPELAGGALLDLGVYPINFALMHDFWQRY